MTDRYRDDVELFSLPGHDRDCALAMLSQSRHRASSALDEIQVAHLVAIGHRAGRAAAEARVRAEVAEERQQLRRVAEVSHLFTGDDHWPDCPGCAINAILDVAGSERCGICGGHLTAGGCERHHDTTPEPQP